MGREAVQFRQFCSIMGREAVQNGLIFVLPEMRLRQAESCWRVREVCRIGVAASPEVRERELPE